MADKCRRSTRKPESFVRGSSSDGSRQSQGRSNTSAHPERVARNAPSSQMPLCLVTGPHESAESASIEIDPVDGQRMDNCAASPPWAPGATLDPVRAGNLPPTHLVIAQILRGRPPTKK